MRIGLIILLLMEIGALGCGADPDLDESDLDLVVTYDDPAFQFGSPRTYALPDQVVVISDDTSTPAGAGNANVSALVLQTIADQMNARGYAQVGRGSRPDLMLEVGQMTATDTQVYYDAWYSYYGSFYGGYYPAYGVGWAPVSTAYVVESTVGSLIINTTDPTRPDTENKKIPSVWVAVLHGLLNDTPEADANQRIQSGIQQAFAQSPYFTRNP